MFWKKKGIERKIDVLNNAVSSSFSNVKKDTESIFQWLNYFYQKSIEQENVIAQQQKTISTVYEDLKSIPRTSEDIKKVIDSYYSYEGIMKQIKELDERISELSGRALAGSSLQHEMGEIRSRVSEIERYKPAHHESREIQAISSRIERLEHKKPSLKERIIRRITRNSKEYIRSVIMSYIGKYSEISSLQLKDMIVDEQGLCSKSSFYRLMEEIEGLDSVGVLRKGKEKYYLSKVARKI